MAEKPVDSVAENLVDIKAEKPVDTAADKEDAALFFNSSDSEKEEKEAEAQDGEKPNSKPKSKPRRKKNKKKTPKFDIQAKNTYNDKTMEELESVVLGSAQSFAKTVSNVLTKAKDKIDDSSSSDDDEAPEEASSKKPAWVDDDDIKQIKPGSKRSLRNLKRQTDGAETVSSVVYQARLQQELERVTGGVAPAWAMPSKASSANKRQKFSDSESDSDGEALEAELVRRTGNWLGTSKYIPKETISFKRLHDPTYGHRTRKPLTNVEFHESSPVLLVAGESHKVQLFKIGTEVTLEANHKMSEFKINAAHFIPQSSIIAVSGQKKNYYHTVDIVSETVARIPITFKNGTDIDYRGFSVSFDGKYMAFIGSNGSISLLSAKSHEWIGNLQMNGQVNSVCFPKNDSSVLYSYGDMGQVFKWDLGTRRVMERWSDEGCLKGMSLTTSPDNRYLAAGSSSGFVNLYDLSLNNQNNKDKQGNRRPVSTFDHLTTSADCLTFNPTSELLLFTSRRKENSVKLAHLDSGSVYTNFPGHRAGLKSVTCASFSSDSSLLCMGNDLGQCVMFRLHHYRSNHTE